MEEIIFKKIPVEDWEKFRTIRLIGLQTDPGSFGGIYENESKENVSYWKDRFENPERCFYAAEVDSRFVAIAGLAKMNEDNWMLRAVYILPEFRRRNISKELISFLFDYARGLNVKKVSLMVNSYQENAVNLYKKMGFEIIKTEKDQKMGDGKFYDEYYMEKILK